MPKTRGGRKKQYSNLANRQRVWDNLSADVQRATKRPGSIKK